MEEKYRHFLFGIVASVGLCFIILVFFTGDEALKDNPVFLNFFFFLLLIFLFLLIFHFVLEIIFVSSSTKWHIVTECSQDQELRSKRNLLFHQDITVFPSSIISYCEAVERVEFAGSDCYFIPGSFEGCANLEYIKLPHRLERIPDNMFRNCSSLKEIIIPSTVKSIGKNAFDGCSGLTSVEIPAGVVDPGLFPAVTGECRVVVTGEITGSTVEKLRSMIDGMSAGAKIHLDLSKTTGLTTIAGFDGCRRLVSVVIPKGVSHISIRAFANSGLTSVVIPSSVLNIGYCAFEFCSSLTKAIFWDPDGWYHGTANIGNQDYMMKLDNSYDNASTLRGDSWGLIKTSIGERAFSGCSWLTSGKIPAGVISIGDDAFYGCSGLSSVEIPSSVTSIGNSAFRECSRLTSVTFGDTTGWYVTTSSSNAENKTGGTEVSVSDTDFAANATLVRSTYYNYYWYKVD